MRGGMRPFKRGEEPVAVLIPGAVFVVTALVAARDRLVVGEAGLVEAVTR